MKPKFRKVSPWQKPDCLFCERPATIEAYRPMTNGAAMVRCCAAADCMTKAAATADRCVQAYGRRVSPR